jgi:pimeloyl-ACP methyl ester carboxylesterase
MDLPEVDGVVHRFVELPTGVRLHVAEAGEGEPVVLLHGWPQHWYCWRSVVPGLAARFRLLMPDLRGFGWSDAPGTGYDPPTFATDVVAMLDALGLERVRLVGHDWGGWTSFVLGLDHRERFDRILVLASPHPWTRLSGRVLIGLWRTWYVLVNATPGLGPAVIARTGYVPWLIGLGGHRHLWSEDDRTVYGGVLADPARANATAALYRYYLRLVTEALVARRFDPRRLDVPTRLLFGAEDFLIPRSYLRGGERHGADFEIELLPGCGHFIPEERPAFVVERALEFFPADSAIESGSLRNPASLVVPGLLAKQPVGPYGTRVVMKQRRRRVWDDRARPAPLSCERRRSASARASRIPRTRHPPGEERSQHG